MSTRQVTSAARRTSMSTSTGQRRVSNRVERATSDMQRLGCGVRRVPLKERSGARELLCDASGSAVRRRASVHGVAVTNPASRRRCSVGRASPRNESGPNGRLHPERGRSRRSRRSRERRLARGRASRLPLGRCPSAAPPRGARVARGEQRRGIGHDRGGTPDSTQL